MLHFLDCIYSLFLAKAIWLVVVHGYCFFQYRKQAKALTGYQMRWFVTTLVLVPASLVMLARIFFAIAFGGPSHGRVIDAMTGKPIANAHVVVLWTSTGVQIRLPVVFEIFASKPCNIRSETVLTDENGQFLFSRWYGPQILRYGCTDASAYLAAPGYHERVFPDDAEFERGVHPTAIYRHHTISMTAIASATP